MQTNHTSGQQGEDQAVSFLIQNKHEILCRNYRYKNSEIDIISKKYNCIHFTEVKFRINNTYGYPEEFVSKDQKKSIMKAANEYIFLKKWDGRIQFDIIAICGKDLEYFEDAFY